MGVAFLRSNTPVHKGALTCVGAVSWRWCPLLRAGEVLDRPGRQDDHPGATASTACWTVPCRQSHHRTCTHRSDSFGTGSCVVVVIVSTTAATDIADVGKWCAPRQSHGGWCQHRLRVHFADLPLQGRDSEADAGR